MSCRKIELKALFRNRTVNSIPDLPKSKPCDESNIQTQEQSILRHLTCAEQSKQYVNTEINNKIKNYDILF